MNGDTRIVGDKFPQCMFMMHQFVELSELLRLVIYRDCRDVASSFLKMLDADWKNQQWARALNTVEKDRPEVGRWDRDHGAIYRSPVHRAHEALASDPESELRRIARWLGVDPSGFDPKMVHGSSVGNYRCGLSARQLDDVLRVASPTLARLGYALD